MLDRLCLDGSAPLRCEVERVREALGRVTAYPVRLQLALSHEALAKPPRVGWFLDVL